MGLRNALLGLERKFAWGLLGFISGTLLGVVGLYYALHERRPSISVQVVSQFDILDVRQPLQDLSILFQGADIQRSNQNLRTLHVQFSNDGEADLLQTQYDQSEPWGLILRGGRILKVQLLDASSPYIRSNLAPQLVGDTVVHLNKLILERGRHFTLDLLVLHAKSGQPTLSVTGKIVGVDSIAVRFNAVTGNQPGVWSRALSGSPWTQVVRVPIYSVAGLIVLGAIVASAVGISSILTNRARKRRAREIRLILDTTSPEEVLAREILEHIYSVSGASALVTARSLVQDRDFLSDGVSGASWRSFLHASNLNRHMIGRDVAPSQDDFPRGQFVDVHYVADVSDPLSPAFAQDLARRLRNARLLTRKDGVHRVHPAFDKLLSLAIERLAPEHVEAAGIRDTSQE